MTAIVLVATTTGASAGSAANRLHSAVERLTDRPQGPPGAIVLVQRGPRLSIVRAGVANARTGAPMRPGKHMRIASTAKAYSGGVVLSLVADGELSLGDTIGDLLPWTPEDWWSVTLGQALHHTSGLPDFSASTAFQEHLFANLTTPVGARRLLRFVFDEDLEFEPGTEYRYSNSDNVAAALMAQAATGRWYGAVLRGRVLRPLGLRRTSLPKGADMPRPYIHGYDLDEGGELEDVSELFAAGYSWASGGIVSTPIDQNRFIRAYVGRGLFDAGVQAQQFDFVPGGSEPTGPGRNAAGLAIFRYRTRCGTMFGHTGNTPGYTQFFAASRNGQRSVVVSINAQITPTVRPDVFDDLRRVFTLGVCAANGSGRFS
jgi:D-alanyl-D-alanine carboxypeptidase